MAKIEVTALDEYAALIKSLTKDKSEKIIKSAIYEGAKIVADEIKSELEGLETYKNMHDGPTEIEKEDMIVAFGISPMKKTDSDINVKIGFDGYGRQKTKRFPTGVPIPLTVRSLLSGTSFRKKNDFVRRAVNRSKKKAINKMNQTINEEFQKELRNDG